jgi:hypothetical protein
MAALKQITESLALESAVQVRERAVAGRPTREVSLLKSRGTNGLTFLDRDEAI